MNSRLKNYTVQIIPYFLIVIAAFTMLLPQLHSHAFVSGLDYYFHMSRTYETAMQIKTGHFSYFLSLFSWDHNARIVNALYGPVGGYISGMILLFAGSWYHWEIWMSLIALVLSGATMYHLGRYWRLKPDVDFLISVLYMLSSPINDFIFKQTFSGFGATLVPLAVLMASEALVEHDVSPIKLALTLVLIIEIHLMTFALSIVFLIPCLLISFVLTRRFRCRLIMHVFEAAGLMTILSFNVWGVILEVFGSNFHHVIPTFPGSHLGTRSYNTIMNTYPQTPLSQSPSIIGMGVMIFIIVTVFLWGLNVFHVNYAVNVLMLFGIFFVWASSAWFPWSFIDRHCNVIGTVVQFPKRCLPMGLALIYLLMGIILTKLIQSGHWPNVYHVTSLILLFLIVGWCWQNNSNYLKYKIRNYQSPAVIDWISMNWRVDRNPNRLRNSLRSDYPSQFLNLVGKPVSDYLPTGVTYRNSDQFYSIAPYRSYNQIYWHHLPFRWGTLPHGGEFITLYSRKDQTQTLPFAKYAHTQMILNHRYANPKIDQVGAIRVRLHHGFNQLLIRYQPSQWFRIGMLISVLTWLGGLVAWGYSLYARFCRPFR